MGWVTINGKHVLIGEDNSHVTGGGHTGTHDVATSTGNATADNATRIVSKMGSFEEKKGRRTVRTPAMAYQVEFRKNGRLYRTLGTRNEGEAKAWEASIRATGWAASGRPGPME